MGELGSGMGTSYPSAVDIDTMKEANQGEASPTTVRAAVINDANAAIVAIETELGTSPKGTFADVKTRLESLEDILFAQNLLPNSRFGVFSCYIDRSIGSAISVSSHTIGTNTVIAYTPNTQNLAVGKQVRFTAGDASLSTCPHTITGLTVNVSFQFNLEGVAVAAGGGAATAYESTVGDPGATVYGPDYWTKTTSLAIERILTSDIPTVVPGSMYGIKATKGAATEEYLWYPVFGYTLLGLDSVKVHTFGGRKVVFGAWIYATVANNCRIFIQDDTGIYYSSFAPLNTLTWLEISRTIPAASTLSILNFGFAFSGSISDVHYIGTPMLAYGSYLGEGNYQPIQNEIVHTVAHISPTHWTGATIAAPSRTFRVHDETHGQVPKDAAGIYAAFEGTCATANSVLAWWRNGLVDPLTHGHILNAQVAGARAFSPVAPIQIKRAGVEVYQYIYVEGATWTLVSMDIVGVWY